MNARRTAYEYAPWAVFMASILAVIFTSQAHAYDEDDLRKLRTTNECEKCDLSEAPLKDANLEDAKLKGANFRGADLNNAILTRAVLKDSTLFGTQLVGATLIGAKLEGARLTNTVLDDADLTDAVLENARLVGTKLSNAKFYRANLTGAIFEPATLPDARSFADAKGLSSLNPGGTAASLRAFRNELKVAGLLQQERELTFAIFHADRVKTGGWEGAVRFVLFEATSGWGLFPLRPLKILLWLLLPFALVYWIAIVRPIGSGGIWRIWNKDLINPPESQPPERVRADSGYGLSSALFFSILSAFHVGWKDLNVGNWITQLNPNESTLRGSGWIRTVSGIQSLSSVYLLALTVLTYFGRPFE